MVDIDLGDYELDQDSNDDLVIKDPNDNEVMKWDKSNGEWDFGTETLANIGSISTDEATIGNKLDYQEDPNSPFTASNVVSENFKLANTYDLWKIVPRHQNVGFGGLQLDGEAGTIYDYIDNADNRTTGDDSFKIGRTAQIAEITITTNFANDRFGVNVKQAREDTNNMVYGDLVSPGSFSPTKRFTLLDRSGTQRSGTVEVYGVNF